MIRQLFCSLILLGFFLASCQPANESATPIAETIVAVATQEPTATEADAVDLGPVSALAVFTGDELSFDTPTGLAVDLYGNFYVIDTLNHRIVTIDVNGNAVASWGTKGTDEGQFNFQFKEDLTFDEQDEVVADLFISTDGFVYIADVGNQRIQVLDLAGSFIRQFPTVSPDEGGISQAFTLTVDPAGNVYTLDLQYYLTKYDGNGTFLSRWGGPGRGNGLFAEVGFVASDSLGNIYATDPYQQVVQKFDSDGLFLAAFNVPREEGGAATYSTPYGLDVDESGNLYITDYLSNRVIVLDSSGTVVAKWGGQGNQLGQMYGPAGIALDEMGNIYVSEVYNQRVQKFQLNQ